MLPRLNLPRNTTNWKLAGTETFRLASSAWLKLYGTNLTNIEKSARRLYWADEGKTLCQVDQAGAEALIVAYLCEHGKFRELFINNVKPHVFVAMNVFLEKWQILCKDIDVHSFISTPIPELQTREGWKILEAIISESDNWKASERYYFLAKMICHGFNYDMRGNAFQLNVLEKSKGKMVITKEQSERYYTSYHTLFPEIHGWHLYVRNCLKETGVLYNLFGHPRVLTGRLDEYDFKEWYAFCPQSTVGCITHIAVTNLQRYIEQKDLDWDILGNCHDSYLAQCPLGEEKELARVMLQFLCQNLSSPRGEMFKMKAEAQVGRNWGSYKKDENEEGLRKLQLN